MSECVVERKGKGRCLHESKRVSERYCNTVELLRCSPAALACSAELPPSHHAQQAWTALERVNRPQLEQPAVELQDELGVVQRHCKLTLTILTVVARVQRCWSRVKSWPGHSVSTSDSAGKGARLGSSVQSLGWRSASHLDSKTVQLKRLDNTELHPITQSHRQQSIDLSNLLPSRVPRQPLHTPPHKPLMSIQITLNPSDPRSEPFIRKRDERPRSSPSAERRRLPLFETVVALIIFGRFVLLVRIVLRETSGAPSSTIELPFVVLTAMRNEGTSAGGVEGGVAVEGRPGVGEGDAEVEDRDDGAVDW